MKQVKLNVIFVVDYYKHKKQIATVLQSNAFLWTMICLDFIFRFLFCFI